MRYALIAKPRILCSANLRVGLGGPRSMVVRCESGIRVPDMDHIFRFVEGLSRSAAEHDRLMQLAHETADELTNEVSAGTRGQADGLGTLIKFAQVASDSTLVSTMLVPGLMQAVVYARLAIGDTPDRETKVATRMGRRDAIVRGRDPARATAYLLKTVLISLSVMKRCWISSVYFGS